MRKSTNIIILVCIQLLLVACSTYQKKGGGSTGYSDRHVKDNIHYIRYSVFLRTDRNVLVKFWHRRASEICGGEDRYTVKRDWDNGSRSIVKLDPSLDESDDIITEASDSVTKGKKDKELIELLDKNITNAMFSDKYMMVDGYAECRRD